MFSVESVWDKAKTLYCLFISPFGRSAPFLFFEKAIEIGAGRKATFGRNDVVAIVGIFRHHLLCSIETNIAKPYSECRLLALVEEGRKVVFWDVKRARKGEHIHSRIFISQMLTPFIKTFLNLDSALCRELWV